MDGVDPQASGADDGASGAPKDSNCAKVKRPLGKTLRLWGVVGAFYGLVAGAAVGGAMLVRKALAPGMELDDRLMYLFWAVSLLAPAFFLALYFVRLRVRTGRWRGTPEQRKADREARLAKACGTGKLGACGAQRQTWGKLMVAWASATSMDRTQHAGARAAAWLVLVGYVLLILASAAVGAIAIGAAFDSSNTLTQSALFAGLGLGLLIVPAVAARKLIRGIREGKVGTTREELEAMRAQERAWRARESQKPLKNKLTNAVTMLVIYGLWWLRVMLPHGKHHESWVGPALAMPVVVYMVWAQFRAPKGTGPGAASGDAG